MAGRLLRDDWFIYLLIHLQTVFWVKKIHLTLYHPVTLRTGVGTAPCASPRSLLFICCSQGLEDGDQVLPVFCTVLQSWA